MRFKRKTPILYLKPHGLSVIVVERQRVIIIIILLFIYIQFPVYPYRRAEPLSVSCARLRSYLTL